MRRQGVATPEAPPHRVSVAGVPSLRLRRSCDRRAACSAAPRGAAAVPLRRQGLNYFTVLLFVQIVQKQTSVCVYIELRTPVYVYATEHGSHGSLSELTVPHVLGPTARSAIPERSNGGHDEGAEQRRWVGGCRAGPETGRALPARGRVGGAGRASGPGFLQRFADATAGSRQSRPRGSQGAQAGALGGKMWVILRRIQQAHFRRNRREPRHVGCSAPSTTSARSHALFRGFSYKNWADRASEGRLASKPWWGDKMRVFSRMCARFPGWFPRRFFARTRFLEVCATTFSANSVGICPHIAGQLIFSRGTKRDQNNHAPRPARSGRS